MEKRAPIATGKNDGRERAVVYHTQRAGRVSAGGQGTTKEKTQRNRANQRHRFQSGLPQQAHVHLPSLCAVVSNASFPDVVELRESRDSRIKSDTCRMPPEVSSHSCTSPHDTKLNINRTFTAQRRGKTKQQTQRRSTQKWRRLHGDRAPRTHKNRKTTIPSSATLKCAWMAVCSSALDLSPRGTPVIFARNRCSASCFDRNAVSYSLGNGSSCKEKHARTHARRCPAWR